MMNFLKSFFANEKNAEEKALQHKHDIMKLDLPASDKKDEEEEGCKPQGGCGGCGCH